MLGVWRPGGPAGDLGAVFYVVFSFRSGHSLIRLLSQMLRA